MSIINEIYLGLCRYVQAHRYKDAEDLISEGIVAVLRAEGRYNHLPGREQIKVLGRTAINAAISAQRKENRYLKLFNGQMTERQTENTKKLRDILFDLKTLLSEFDKEVFILLYHEDFNGAETAILLSHSPATISRSRSRIQEALLELL